MTVQEFIDRLNEYNPGASVLLNEEDSPLKDSMITHGYVEEKSSEKLDCEDVIITGVY